MIEYDSTKYYDKLPDGRVWQYYTLWSVTKLMSMAIHIYYGQLLADRI